MNPENFSREDIELRITMLLLGELSAAEAEALRQTIAQDAGLKKLHDELQATIGLVRTVEKNSADASLENPDALKLSDERRQKLLAHFKTPRPQGSFWIRPMKIPHLIPVLAAIAGIAILAAMLMPSLAAAKKRSSRAFLSSVQQKDVLVEAVNEKSAKKTVDFARMGSADQPSGAPSPTAVTVASEPVLAPPPTPIVLPPTESPATVITGSPAEPAKGGVISQNIVGYVNKPVDSDATFNNQIAGTGGFAGGGGGGGGQSPARNVELALNSPDFRRAGVKGERSNLGDEMRAKTPADQAVSFDMAVATATPVPDSLPATIAPVLESPASTKNPENHFITRYDFVAATSTGALSGTSTAENLDQVATEKKYGAGNAVTRGASQLRSIEPANRTRTFKVTPLPGAKAAIAGDEIPAVTVAMGETIALPPAEVPALQAGAPVGQTLDFKTDTLAAGDRTDGTLAKQFYRNLARDGEDKNGSVAPAPVVAPTSPVAAGVVGNSGRIQLGRSEIDAPTSGTTFAARKPVTVTLSDSSVSGLAKDDVSGLRYVMVTNGISGGELALNGNNSFFDAGKTVADTDQDSLQKRMGQKRSELVILDDATSLSPRPTLDKAELKTINEEILTNQKEYTKQLVQLNSLKAIKEKDGAKLREVLPTMYPDSALTGMLDQLNDAQRKISGPQTDYSKDSLDVKRLQQSIDTLNQQIDDRTSGIMAGLETQTKTTKSTLDTLQKTVANAKEQDLENAVKLQPYYAEKRKLLDLQETHKMLNLKLTANSIDARIPTTSMVQITDAAEPSKKQTFWQSLRGEYASTAKIKVENDGGIISGFASPAAQNQPYDPYFIQTTFEIMQSSAVLGSVVDMMHLDTAWADKNSGQKLSKQRAIELLKSRLSLQPAKNTKLITISVTSDKPEEAAALANNVARAYLDYRVTNNQQTARTGLEVLQAQYLAESNQIAQIQSNLDQMRLHPAEFIKPVKAVAEADVPVRRAPANAPIPQPEILTSENAFSTFSLNVSDVSFKLAEASLEKGQMPDAATIRSEEFINAFDYRDPEAAAGQPLAFASERARYPFAHNRELLRFSIKTAAAGRPAGRALNLVLLVDNSGSMERADRVAIIREALRVLAGQLQPQDTVSVVTFARTARLWADGVAGDKAGATLAQVGDITPEGGTNLEEAMRLAYETARRHYLANGLNRVVLLTDGAANLGNSEPAVLKQKVEAQRKQGIALDCFGIGFEGYDDDLLEQLSRNGDGRYAFINSPEEAGKEFAAKLAGALQVAASDVKVQVEFNPQRVISYRQIGYAKHQLTKEQFRDNTVDAAEIAAQEAGNALYTVETKPDGTGPVATVHVRYKVPGTTDYQERSWDVAYDANAPALEQADAAMRLAGTASAFSEWLAVSPFAQEVTLDDLLKLMSGVPAIYGADERPKKLEWMIRQAKSLSGK